MDQANRYFTQAIVGQPRRVVLGVLSRGAESPAFEFPDLETGPPENSPWTRFIPRLVLGQKLQRDSPSHPSGPPRKLASVLAGLSLVMGVAAILAVTSGQVGRPDAAETSQRQVEAYVPPLQQPEAAAEPIPAVDNIALADTVFEPIEGNESTLADGPAIGAAPSLPFGTAESREVVPAKVQVAPPSNAVQPSKATDSTKIEESSVPPVPKAPPVSKPSVPAVRAQATPKQQTQDKEPSPSAVIVDMSKAPAKETESPTVFVEQREPAKTGQRRLVGPVQETSPQVASTVAQSGATLPTLVDIGPDGSYVLITNPATRLPQRFSVGQKIFTGETIQNIDVKSGSVQLDARTIKLQ